MEIIAFSGKLGSGKDYVAQQFIQELNKIDPKNTLFLGLADQLKINLAVDYPNYEDEFFGLKNRTEFSRTIMQQTGQAGQDLFDDLIWVRLLFATMRLYNTRGVKRFVVTDVRYKQELTYFLSHGAKVFRIIAEDRTTNKVLAETQTPEGLSAITHHKSEIDLDDVPLNAFTGVIDNSVVNQDNLMSVIRSLITHELVV